MAENIVMGIYLSIISCICCFIEVTCLFNRSCWLYHRNLW